jgi:Mn-dependent DtxR family transcriptional regulator
MAEKGSVVQTGVDRLLDVLRTEGTLAVKTAAVKLGVSTSAVLEWAKLLEEEGLIKIKYRFATAYLEGKNLNTPEYQKVKKELLAEKELLDEKLESTNNFLAALEDEVKSLKELFGSIGKHVGGNMDQLKSTLQQLESYQAKKEVVDKQIVASKSRYVERLEALNKRLSTHQGTAKEWYEQMYGEVVRGGELLELEQNELALIEDNEKLMERQLSEMRSLLDVEVINKLGENRPEIDRLKRTLLELKKRYITMKEEAESEKAALLKLIIENEKNVGDIEKVQKELIAKMDAASTDFGVTTAELKDFPKRMEEFFSKKNLVETILNRLHYNEFEFKKRLDELTTKSSQLGKIPSLEKFREQLKDLESDVNELGKKREYFTKEMKNLVSLLRK